MGIDPRALSDIERQIIREREARETLLRSEARATRNRLEKGAPQSPRLGIVNFLNGISAESASRELPPIAALEGIRKRQALGRVTAEIHNRNHQAWLRKGAPFLDEDFNRLDTTEARGSSTPLPSAFNPWARETRPESNFDFSSEDPGREPGRYGTFAEGAPTLRPGEHVRDVETRVHGKEAGRHQPSGQVEGIEAGFLLDVTRLLLAALKERAYKPV